MVYPRWYPTATTLPDGRVLIISGSTTCNGCQASIPEIYDPSTNSVAELTNANLTLENYPYVFVLPDGRMLVAGASESPTAAYTLDVANQAWTVVDPVTVEGGSAVMYQPGKVMKSALDTFVLDMTQASPQWRMTARGSAPRVRHHDLVLLPDGTTLVIGGDTASQVKVHEAEIWSPVTETWTSMASMQSPRGYHSTALLLPDGRVVSAGGGRLPGKPDYLSAEIFSPPYLFKGARPAISSAPATIPYGATFSVNTPDASQIANVSLIRTGAVTHSFDQNQRYLSLSFQPVGNGLDVVAPANANLAPPGYYLLFIVNTNGVPSIASFVKLQ